MFSDLPIRHHKGGIILILFNLNIMFGFWCKSMRFTAVSSVITRWCVQKTLAHDSYGPSSSILEAAIQGFSDPTFGSAPRK